MPTTIQRERPDTRDASALVEELEGELEPYYPRESRHGYSIAKLLAEDVAFFVTRHDGAVAGCGGVKLFGTEYGEIKRMYVRPAYRGLGIARLVLERLEDHARGNGVQLLRLETGIYQTAAIGLYERMGFRRIPPFGAYWDDPLSVFFEKGI